MNLEVDIQTNKNLSNIHLKCLISFLTINLVSALIFDFYLNLWQCVTLYTGIYSSLVPFKFYLYRPFSIILFLVFFNTFRNSIVLSFNNNLNLSQEFYSLSFFLFISVIVICILDILFKTPQIKYDDVNFNNFYILISLFFILILPICSILIPPGLEQIFLLSNFFLLSLIAIPKRNQSISRIITNLATYIILYLISVFIYSSVNEEFALNRTIFSIPIYLSIIILFKYFVINTNFKEFSFLKLFLFGINFFRNKKILFYSFIFIIVFVSIFIFSITQKITEGIYFDDFGQILKFVIDFQIYEFIAPEVIEKYSSRLAEISNNYSDIFAFKSIFWIFSILIPSFIFNERPVLNISEYITKNINFEYVNYFEPFFHFFVEGYFILFLIYVIFIPYFLISLVLRFSRNSSFSLLYYYLFFSIYSYMSASYGFTRYMLAPLVGSIILFFTKRLKI